MNSFWAGLKSRKILHLFFLVFLSLIGVIFTDSNNKVYADYEYNKAECKKGGLEYDGVGFGTRPGHGCVFKSISIKDGKIEVGSEHAIGQPNNLINNMDKYYLPEGGQCFNGYLKKTLNGINYCDLVDKKAKNAGYAPGSSPENELTQDFCEENGGYWKQSGGIGDAERCYLNNLSGNPEPFNNKNSFPSKYLTLNKCAPGFIKSKNQQIKKFTELTTKAGLWWESDQAVYTCAKEGTEAGKNIEECNKKENKDKPECKENPTGDTDGSSSEDKSSCKIDGVGWIICPGANFLAQAAMDSYKFIADNMLQVRSNELFTNSSQDKSSGKSLMEVWGNFRDIANVLFVILFTIVIISQITSLGISNYGIKKMLPRLLIFAILINVSYYISVIAVDASNILGRSIYNTIIGSVEWSGAASSGVHSLGQVVAGGLALGTGAVFFGATMFLALMSAMIGMAVMIITLMIRQAAVIILVVLSPIAFASAILPNTEGIFNKWKSIFKSMLVIYPMASIVVSLSVLASNTLAATASGPFSFLIEGLYLTLPFVGMAGVVALIRGALAALDKLTNANITGRLSSLAGGANKFMGNTSVAKHAANWSRGNRGALTGRNKNPTTRTGRILSAIGGLGGKRGLGIAATAGYFRNSRLRADSNAQIIEENQKWDDEDRRIAMLEQKETNGIITDSERRSLNSLRAVKQKREDDQITAQARANAIKWKMAPVKDVLDNSGNITTPSTETLAKTSLANAIASRDSDKIKMAVESAKMVYGQNKTNNMISSYIENNGISQESAHALSNNFYKDFKDSSPSLSSTIEYAKSNSKGIETETVRTMDPATGKMIDKIQANRSQINQAIDGAFDNIKMAVVNNMDAEEVKKWNAALYKMPTPERKMHARMAREAERNGAGDVKQRTELSNLYRIHK